MVLDAPERVKLGASTTLYVATTGNNANTGLTSAAPFATIQHALDFITNSIDLSKHNLSIQLADGTYTEGAYLGVGWVGGTAWNVVITGNPSSPGNVVLSTSGACVTASGDGSGCRVEHLRMDSSTLACLYTVMGAYITFGSVIFGNANDAHMLSDNGIFNVSNDYTIAGSAPYHISCRWNGMFQMFQRTITIQNTPHFSYAFVRADFGGAIHYDTANIVGAASGKRYEARGNGVIDTSGVTLPGNVAGTIDSGGQIR